MDDLDYDDCDSLDSFNNDNDEQPGTMGYISTNLIYNLNITMADVITEDVNADLIQ